MHASPGILSFPLLQPLHFNQQTSLALTASQQIQSKSGRQTKKETKKTVYTSPTTGNAYTLHHILGKGTYGTVYKASCVMKNAFDSTAISTQEVAVKLSARDKDRDQCIEEAYVSILNKKQQNFIIKLIEGFSVPIHEKNEEPSTQRCTVFELGHKNLWEINDSGGGLPLKKVKAYAIQLVQALAYLREHGIAHGDLKPENIMKMRPDGDDLRLIDFGLAFGKNHDSDGIIQSFYYRAPEVAMKLPYDARADMWSLGCILAELYTGKPLFPIKQDKKKDKKASKITIENKTILHEIAKKLGFSFKKQFKESQFAKDRKFFTLISTFKENVLSHYLLKFKKFSQADQEDLLALIDLIQAMLNPDPQARISPKAALLHPFFQPPKPLCQQPQPLLKDPFYCPPSIDDLPPLFNVPSIKDLAPFSACEEPAWGVIDVEDTKPLIPVSWNSRTGKFIESSFCNPPKNLHEERKEADQAPPVTPKKGKRKSQNTAKPVKQKKLKLNKNGIVS